MFEQKRTIASKLCLSTVKRVQQTWLTQVLSKSSEISSTCGSCRAFVASRTKQNIMCSDCDATTMDDTSEGSIHQSPNHQPHFPKQTYMPRPPWCAADLISFQDGGRRPQQRWLRGEGHCAKNTLLSHVNHQNFRLGSFRVLVDEHQCLGLVSPHIWGHFIPVPGQRKKRRNVEFTFKRVSATHRPKLRVRWSLSDVDAGVVKGIPLGSFGEVCLIHIIMALVIDLDCQRAKESKGLTVTGNHFRVRGDWEKPLSFTTVVLHVECLDCR